jgi:membrane protein DedA with SNARE-associated domain
MPRAQPVGAVVGAPIQKILSCWSPLTLTGVMEPVPLLLVWVGLIVGDALVFHWGHRRGLLRTRFRSYRPETAWRIFRNALPARAMYIFVIRFLPGIVRSCSCRRLARCPIAIYFGYDGIAAVIELPLLVLGALRAVAGRKF